MDDRRKTLYLLEINAQGKMMAHGVNALGAAKADVHVAATWFAVQSLLVTAANISKLLWGRTVAAQRDRRELREQLEVGDDSPLRLRDVRDKFEHIDGTSTSSPPSRANPSSVETSAVLLRSGPTAAAKCSDTMTLSLGRSGSGAGRFLCSRS